MTNKTLRNLCVGCVYMLVGCMMLALWQRLLLWALVDAILVWWNLTSIKLIDRMIEEDEKQVGKGD